MQILPQTVQEAITSFYYRRHPAYAALIEHWDFCESCYSGGREWFEKNIHKYLKEGDDEFKDRKARAMRLNHTKEVVDLVQKYLFKTPVNRDVNGAPEVLKKFWMRSTRASQSIDEVMRLVGTKNSLTGRCAIVVDTNAPPIGVDKISVAQAEEMNARIYCYVVPARDVLDYAWSSEDGELLWVKLREYYRDDVDPLNSSGLSVERVRLWTRTEWMLFECDPLSKNTNGIINARLKDSGVHDLGRVPVFLADHTVSEDPFRVPALVDDIVYLDKTIANYMSNLDAIIQDQTFSQLAIPAQALSGSQRSAVNQIVEMGTKRIFTYDGGAGSTAKPEFISPDPKQASVITDTVNMLVTQIYSTIGLSGERTKQDNALGIDNSSGVAKAYDFERVNSLLLSKAKRLEAVENWIVEIVLMWAGESIPDEPLVTYPTTFDVASLGDELVTAEALMRVKAPIEMRRQHMKEVAAKMFPQVSIEEWETLEKAIDGWTDIEAAQAAATVDQTKASTEATIKGAETQQIAAKTAAKSASDKPVAAKSRQGSVTSTTKSTPKNSAK